MEGTEFGALPPWSSEDEDEAQTPRGGAALPGNAGDGELPLDIEDYTCATAWESFVAAVEEALRGWGLAGATGAEGKGTSTAPAGAQPPPARSVQECQLTHTVEDARSSTHFRLRYAQQHPGQDDLRGSAAAVSQDCFDLSSGERSAAQREAQRILVRAREAHVRTVIYTAQFPARPDFDTSSYAGVFWGCPVRVAVSVWYVWWSAGYARAAAQCSADGHVCVRLCAARCGTDVGRQRSTLLRAWSAGIWHHRMRSWLGITRVS
jgi:hypothetical protein